MGIGKEDEETEEGMDIRDWRNCKEGLGNRD